MVPFKFISLARLKITKQSLGQNLPSTNEIAKFKQQGAGNLLSSFAKLMIFLSPLYFGASVLQIVFHIGLSQIFLRYQPKVLAFFLSFFQGAKYESFKGHLL